MNKPIKRGVAYIRESTEEQDKGFSPESQQKGITEYATRNDIIMVNTYKDLLSGTNATKRPSFQRMIEDAKQHKFDIVLVFHTSRFARNVQESRKYKDLLRRKLEINVVSVTQQFGDWDNPSAFLNEGVNELFDEHLSKQISFWVRTNLAEKREQGKQLGNPPFGYYKKKLGYDTEKERTIYSGKWLIEEKEARVVKEIFKLYSTGNCSYVDIAVELNKRGIKTKYKNVFTYTSIKGILNNKVYLGHIYSRRKNIDVNNGIHPSIISESLFSKVQSTIAERRNTEGRPVDQHRFYLLQGLVYCYHCIKRIKGKENNENARLLPRMYCQTLMDGRGKKEYLTYNCKFKKETRDCKQQRVPCKIIDDQVIKYMMGFHAPEEIVKRTLEILEEFFSRKIDLPEKDDNLVVQLIAKRKRLNIMFEAGQLIEEKYLKKIKAVERDIAKYSDTSIAEDINDLTAKKIPTKEILEKTEKFLRNFKSLWDNLGDDEVAYREKRAWTQMTIKRVWVKDKTVVAIEPRDDFKPLFASHRKVLGQAPSLTPSKK